MHATIFTQAAAELDEYLAGDRVSFTVPFATAGNPFQEQVWRRLLDIPRGTTTTYGALAKELGGRALAQEVGQRSATTRCRSSCRVTACSVRARHDRADEHRSDMSAASDWNTNVIAEFRAHQGQVGGAFEGAPMVLLHHRGRRSGTDFVAPVMSLPSDIEPGTIYVFATKSGAPTNPEWYRNLITAGSATVEAGTETYPVDVQEVTGEERDRIYAEQARRYPGFLEYAERTAGIRTIPVVALRRTVGSGGPPIVVPASGPPSQGVNP